VVYIRFDSKRATRSEFTTFLSLVREFRHNIRDLLGTDAVTFNKRENMWLINVDTIIRSININNAFKAWSIVTAFRDELDKLAQAPRQLISNYDEVVGGLGRIQNKALSTIFGIENGIVATVEPETASPIVPIEFRDLYASITIRVGNVDSEVAQRIINEWRTRLTTRFAVSYRVFDVRTRSYSRYSYSFVMVSYDQGAVRIDMLKGLVGMVVDTLIKWGIHVEVKVAPQIKLDELVTGGTVDPDKVYREIRDYIDELNRRLAQAEGEVPPSPIEVRPYQVDAVVSALTWLSASGRALIEVPTGGGKTMIAALIAYIISKYNPDVKLLMTTFRSDIVRQFGDYLADKLAPMTAPPTPTTAVQTRQTRDRLIINYVYGGDITRRCFRSGVEVGCPRRTPSPDIITATSASLYYAVLFAYYVLDELKKRARKIYPELLSKIEQGRISEVVNTASEKCDIQSIVDAVRSAAASGAIPPDLLKQLSACIARRDLVREIAGKEHTMSIRDINRMIKPKLMDLLVRVLYAPVVFNLDALTRGIPPDFVKRAVGQIDALIEGARRRNERAEQMLRSIIANTLRILLTRLYMRISGSAVLSPEVLRSIAEDLSSIYSNYLPEEPATVAPNRAAITRAIMDLMRKIKRLSHRVLQDLLDSGLQHVASTVRFRAIDSRLDYMSMATTMFIRSQISEWLGNIATPYRAKTAETAEKTAATKAAEVSAEEGEPVVVAPDEVIEIEDLPEIKAKTLTFSRTTINLAFKLLRLRNKRVFIVIDEAHHTPAASIVLLLLFFKRALVLGLTATPYRGDKLDMLIYGLAGSIVYSITSSELIGRGHLVPAYIYNIVYHIENNEPLNNAISELVNSLDELKSALKEASYLVPRLEKRGDDTVVVDSEGNVLSPAETRDRLIRAAKNIADAVRSFFGKFQLSAVFDSAYELAKDEETLMEIIRTRDINKALRYIRNSYGRLRDIPVPDLLAQECAKPEYVDHLQCICVSQSASHTADLFSYRSEHPRVLGRMVKYFITEAYCKKYGKVKLITPEFFARMAVRVLALHAVATLNKKPDGGAWTSKERVESFRRRLGGLMRSIEMATSSIYIRAVNNDMVRNWMLADSVMQTVNGMTSAYIDKTGSIPVYCKTKEQIDEARGDEEQIDEMRGDEKKRKKKRKRVCGIDYTTYPFAIVTPWREGADRMHALMVARVAVHCYTYPERFALDPNHENLLGECLKRAQELVGYIHGNVDPDVRKAIYDALRRRSMFGIVATTVLNEGVDIPSLSILAIHRGGRGRVGTKQVVGRGLRPYSDGTYTKRALVLIDIMDMGNPSSVASNRCRMTFYCVDEPMWVKTQISDDVLYDFKHARYKGVGYYTIPSPRLYYTPQTGVGSFFEIVGYSTFNHNMAVVQVDKDKYAYYPPFLETARKMYGYWYARELMAEIRTSIFGGGSPPRQSMLRCADVNTCLDTFRTNYKAVKSVLPALLETMRKNNLPVHTLTFKSGEVIVRECIEALKGVDVMVVQRIQQQGRWQEYADYVAFDDAVRYDYASSRFTVAIRDGEQMLNLARRLSACLAFNWAYSTSNCKLFAAGGQAGDPLAAFLCTMRELYVIDADAVDVDSAIVEVREFYKEAKRDKSWAGRHKSPEHAALSFAQGKSPVCLMNLLYRIRSIMSGPYKDEFESLIKAYESMYGIKVMSPPAPKEEEKGGEEGRQEVQEREEARDYLANVLARYLVEYAPAYIYALKELC